MADQDVVIVSAKRTPLGLFQGALAGLTAPELGAAAARAAIHATPGLVPEEIEEVLLGCVLPAGLGQSPARQAALGAGIPPSVPTSTLNKMCGSGLKAVMMVSDQVRAGDIRIALAGGLESMSNAPYLLPKARGGYRMGHGEVLDHMMFDGLQSPSNGQLMGYLAELTARKYNFSRAEQDAFATESVLRARRASEDGAFDAELTPITVRSRKGESELTRDETAYAGDVSKIATLKPAFAKDGSVTAASSSSIADGAAALVVMREDVARARGIVPLARVLTYASHAHEPEWFTTAPGYAIKKVLGKLGWRSEDADLYEVNEAFAAVTLAVMRDLDIDHAQMNVHGGACALGHPLGASGARILTTLVHALAHRNVRRGIAALCIGGGEAVAMAIERIS